ncbi:transcriptional regulator NrdR [Candidatus Uhrbacteria bacterium CG10_big_fil_rev_8_21_14_0_10_48_11]|uniref:Transcriptional repressor NrdR n=1 Tax=Candidatus Uhrbacteria bacterium CG10_big_fil_rev_8_21_14_0_10_48_11 TaxID=1975037 RepID=A0A2M8LF63_9BACT|nr:MAG: transcriptional regulator NrdR [Candidatus Uhrbacteria bacterium CG10_big_fil_rev_8_21_14_0_10_48_11]
MRCPACGEADTKVIDSRLAGSGLAIRRRRECGVCEFRFSTVEEVQILDLTVVKRTGQREPYAREKVLSGIKKAFEKRPLTREDLDRLIQIIEQDIQVLRKPEVTSQQIGEIVMRRLKRVDEVAFIRFASVYQGFSDAAAFHRAILRLTPSRIRKLLPTRKKTNRKK